MLRFMSNLFLPSNYLPSLAGRRANMAPQFYNTRFEKIEQPTIGCFVKPWLVAIAVVDHEIDNKGIYQCEKFSALLAE